MAAPEIGGKPVCPAVVPEGGVRDQAAALRGFEGAGRVTEGRHDQMG